MTLQKIFNSFRIAQTFGLSLIFTFAAFAQAPKTDEPQELPPNKIIEQELKGNETNKFWFEAKAGEYLQIKVEQKGIDVVVKLFDASGKLLAEMDSPNGTQGFEILSFIIANKGIFTVQIGSLESNAAKGRYTIYRETPRSATENDKKILQADTLFNEGTTLINRRTSESFQEAREKFLASSRLYKEIGNKSGEAQSLAFVGVISSNFGEKKVALEYFNQSLPIFQAISDKAAEVGLLNVIGGVYSDLGEKQKALEVFNQALNLSRLIKDKRTEAFSLNNIGAIYYGWGEMQKALEHFNQSLPIAREIGDKFQESKSLHNIGAIYSDSDEKQKALDYFNQSLPLTRVVGDKIGEAATLNSIGLIYSGLGENQKALDYLNQSLIVARQIGNKLQEAQTLNSLGGIYSELSENEKALEFYNKALLLRRNIGDKGGEANTLLNIGLLYSYLGDKKKALDYYNQSLQLQRAIGEKLGESVTLHNIGLLYSNLGENQKALEYYNQSLLLSRAVGNKRGEAMTLHNIGGVYLDLNDKQKALEYFTQSLLVFRAIGNKSGEAAALRNIGLAYASLREMQKALDYYNKSLSLHIAIGDKRGEADALHNIAGVYSKLGDSKKALEFFNQSLRLARSIENKSGQATTLNDMGWVYFHLGENQKALEYYNQSLLLSRAVSDKRGEAATFSNMMDVWALLKNQQLAILYGKQSVNIFQGLRANIKGLDKELQRTYLGSIEQVYRKLAELLIKAGRLPEAEQVLAMLKEEEYFEFVRRDGDLAKAVDKRISLSPSEKEALETYDKIAGEITALGVEYDKLEAEKNNRATSDARRKEILARQDELDKKLEVARVALNKFLEALKDEFGKNDSRVAAVESGLQKDVERLKEPQTVVISTIVGKENLSVIMTTARAQTAHIVPISEENLNLLVAEFRAAVMDSRSEKWREPAQKLYNVLIKPLQKDLDNVRARTLVWSLDGMLRYAPIAALWDKEQGYLIQRYANAVITLASRSDLAQRADGKNRWQALGVGVSKPFAGFSALSYVPQELSGIVRDASVQSKEKQSGILNGKRLLNEDFTFDNFRLYLGRFPVVHAATHFSFVPGTRAEALDSFLLLGNGEKLTLGQMQKSGTIFSGVELLALSACDTAYGGKDADGREIENFGALAQNKGAKSVLASLWRVADASTRDLMINFYANYQKPNLSKAEALRQSQLTLLGETDKTSNRKQVKNGTKKYAHPFYWSPFVLIGNWQ